MIAYESLKDYWLGFRLTIRNVNLKKQYTLNLVPNRFRLTIRNVNLL